jgi:DNA-binding response OmpR family regulator
MSIELTPDHGLVEDPALPIESLRDKSVLVLEDEVLIALDLQRALEDAGVGRVLTFDDQEAALARAILEEPIDLAIMEVRIRGLPCFETAEALRARGIPFIFVTGYGTEIEEHGGFEDVDVVAKPFRDEQVTGALERSLKRAGQI